MDIIATIRQLSLVATLPKLLITEVLKILFVAELMQTGANVLFRPNDDGDLQFGRGIDFFTLNSLNPFGNSNRFTDTLGTQIYANDVIIDWSTRNDITEKVLCYSRDLVPTDTYNNHIDNQPFTRDSLSDWFVCNIKQLINMYNYSILRNYMNFAPFNVIVIGVAGRIWSSTGESVSVALSYSGSSSSLVDLKSNSFRAMVCREYTLTELGL
ncbi:MAG: hypothetical protein KAS32_00055 [Candidatus Peribacteraceae bacterium]|nr:hypothetical protein [Candidatus Peribacteraceae bacterium]